MIIRYGNLAPKIAADAYVQSSAQVIGDVEIGAQSSVWFQAVIRGDVERVRIGRASNVQDHSTIHVTNERWPTILGDGVTVGHRVVLHGCTLGDYCLVGIGAIVLDGVEVGGEVLIGAGSVVVPGSKVPPRSLVLGSPAKVVRALRADEIERLHHSADLYVGYAQSYRGQGI
ncbi:MAG: gamma carbonic anhydrase family protein [Deltaproteobacteria bacterium]|nr:gamma carbonic anhydrase family protein [Deltaproteobacteria bacterium]